MINAGGEIASGFYLIPCASWVVWKNLNQHLFNNQLGKIKIIKDKKENH